MIRLKVPNYFVPHYRDRPFDPLTTRRVRGFLKPGMVREFNSTKSSDIHGFYRHPLEPTARTEKVRRCPLDELVNGRVDLVKIDVEGAEIEVLAGMSRILSENRRVRLVVE